MKIVIEMRRIELGLYKVRVLIVVGKLYIFVLCFNNSKNFEFFFSEIIK